MGRIKQLEMPDGLCEDGKRAHQIIMEYLTALELTNTGGCTAFYSPSRWADRGEQYGLRSLLVVVYDGGDLRPVFNMDAAYDLDVMVYQETGKPSEKTYELYEGMQDKLKEAGMYFEECTGWYCAIYKH